VIKGAGGLDFAISLLQVSSAYDAPESTLPACNNHGVYGTENREMRSPQGICIKTESGTHACKRYGHTFSERVYMGGQLPRERSNNCQRKQRGKPEAEGANRC
jgi:hypothetical protein